MQACYSLAATSTVKHTRLMHRGCVLNMNKMRRLHGPEGPRASLKAPTGQQMKQQAAVEAVAKHAITARHRDDLNHKLVNLIPDTARFVLIGEASHGTKEFYEQRADLTRLLIQERGFSAVLVESDWPDAFRVNRYVLGMGSLTGARDSNANEALEDYKRFPRWMWRNTSVAPFVEWLKDYNTNLRSSKEEGSAVQACRFLGLDVYSLHSSAEAIVEFLRKVDPAAAEEVDKRYQCFNRYGPDAQSYGMATALGHKASCEQAVKTAMDRVFRFAEARRLEPNGQTHQEEALMLEANAMAVAGAEAYYRNMFTRDEVTWNLRDSHFLEVVKLVEQHLHSLAGDNVQPRLVLWAHNSHLGDARATDAGWYREQLNIGQLMREKYGNKVFNIGFTTHTGYVSAADDWGGPVQHKAVRPSLPGSYEHVMHTAVADKGLSGCFGLDLREPELKDKLNGPLLERAIGVIYRPRTELQSHYFDASLPLQFDMMIHHEYTQAVKPLEPGDYWAPVDISETKGDMPELWPVGE